MNRYAFLLGLGLLLSAGSVGATNVILFLHNGDRLTGELVSETEKEVVVRTPWSDAFSVPRTEIREQVIPPPSEDLAQEKAKALELAITQSPPSSTPSPVAPPADTASSGQTKPDPALAAAPEKPRLDNWKWNFRLGTDFIQGAKDRKIYFGQTSLTYSRNYARAPREFLRNRLEYRVDYGETDDRVSANRMVAANKLDMDIGKDYYAYGAFGGGYDRVRKIEYQYEIGPGLGYHILAKKTLALDAELGLNYQFRKGLDTAPDREVVQARFGQELTWEVVPKITLTEQLAFLPFLDQGGEYQVRLEGNLGFGIVQHLSLNLTVRNLYDTQPAPGVPNNEFQFRSSVGVNF
jgi:putative salt-induced outer membrane protein YdiY